MYNCTWVGFIERLSLERNFPGDVRCERDEMMMLRNKLSTKSQISYSSYKRRYNSDQSADKENSTHTKGAKS
jgi:hypothetical protein